MRVVSVATSTPADGVLIRAHQGLLEPNRGHSWEQDANRLSRLLLGRTVHGFLSRLESGRDCKKGYRTVGESKAGKPLRLNSRIVNKIMCSRGGSHTSKGSEKKAFQRCVNVGAQKQWTGLLRQR